MKPGLFIAIGSMPVLGDHAPPLLLLAGRFEEALPPALLKTRTDARLVISPWSDHLLEAFDPVLVNAAVEAACVAVHKTPPAHPTAWRWRLIGAVLFERNFFIRHLYNLHRNGERISHPECGKILTLLNTS